MVPIKNVFAAAVLASALFLPLVSSAAVTVSTDASSPSYQIVAAGASGVVEGVYKFHATGEAVNLQKIGFKLTSGTWGDLAQGSIYDGATQVGSFIFVGTGLTATSTLWSAVTVPKDGDTSLTIKLDFSGIGVSQPVSHSGDLVAVDFLNGQGFGANSGLVISPTGSTSVAGVRVMKSYPTLALGSLPATGIADGHLMRFSVTANAAGQVGIKQFAFRFAWTSATVANVSLYGFSDAAYSQPISGQGANGQIGSTITPSQNTLFGIKVASTPIEIPAGATRYFEVRASVTGTSGGSSFTTTLAGDSTFASNPSSLSSFVWSPNSTTTSALTSPDWFNAFGVFGLPAAGLSQTRADVSPIIAPPVKTTGGISGGPLKIRP